MSESEKGNLLQIVQDDLMKEKSRVKRTWKYEIYGFLVGLVSSLFITFSSACVRAMKQSIPEIELNGLRFLAVYILAVPYFIYKQRLPRISSNWKTRCWLFLFSLSGVVCTGFQFASLGLLKMGEMVSIHRIELTLTLALISWICFQQKFVFVQIVAVMLGVPGVIMVNQADIFRQRDNEIFSLELNNNTFVKEISDNTAGMDPFVLGIIFASIAAITETIHISTQKAGLVDEDVMALCFWYSLFGVLACLISPAFETVTLPTTKWGWFLLIGHLISSALCNYTGTLAQDWASLIVTSLAFGFAVPFYFLTQYFVFQEVASGSALVIEVTGAMLTVVSSSLVPVYELIIHKTEWPL